METTSGTTVLRAASFSRAIYATRSLAAEIINLKSCTSCRSVLRQAAVALALYPLLYGQNKGGKTLSEPQAILDEIDSQGAAAVVKKLSAGNGGQWQYAIRRIESGSP